MMTKLMVGGRPELLTTVFQELRKRLEYLYEYKSMGTYKRYVQAGNNGPDNLFLKQLNVLEAEEQEILAAMRNAPLNPYKILGLSEDRVLDKETIDGAMISTLDNIQCSYEGLWHIERTQYILSEYSDLASEPMTIDPWAEDHAIEYDKLIKLMRERVMIAREILLYEHHLLPNSYYNE